LTLSFITYSSSSFIISLSSPQNFLIHPLYEAQLQHSIINIEVLNDISNRLAAQKADISRITPSDSGTMIKIIQKVDE